MHEVPALPPSRIERTLHLGMLEWHVAPWSEVVPDLNIELQEGKTAVAIAMRSKGADSMEAHVYLIDADMIGKFVLSLVEAMPEAARMTFANTLVQSGHAIEVATRVPTGARLPEGAMLS